MVRMGDDVAALDPAAWQVALYSAGTVWQLSRTVPARRALIRLGAVPELQSLARRSIDAGGPESEQPGSAEPEGTWPLPYDTRMQIQDFCAGCMGVLVVDKEARRALFSDFPNASDLVALSGRGQSVLFVCTVHTHHS